MNNCKNNKTSLTPIICLFLFSFLFMGAGIYYLYFYNMDAVKRQDTEMELADQYVEDLLEWIEKGSDAHWEQHSTVESSQQDINNTTEDFIDESMKDESSNEETIAVQEGWSDDQWYSRNGVTYTPEYAKGYVQCVLEIPSVKIRRGVYSGTWEEIRYNLDIWMVTASRPDYVLGETHFCIYGHNHTQQDLSFNRLKDVQIGDKFTLTSEAGYFEYEVTNIFAVSRSSATDDFVDNFKRPSNKCYIITCGRGANRYLDLIVEGTLQRQLSLREYAEQLK